MRAQTGVSIRPLNNPNLLFGTMYQDDINRIATAIVATAKGYCIDAEIVTADVMDKVSDKLDNLSDDCVQLTLGPWR